MPGALAIVAYRGLIAGQSCGSVDISVRWFSETDQQRIRQLVEASPSHSYRNSDGELVSWELVEILAIEAFESVEPGEEVVGFIASADELAELAR